MIVELKDLKEKNGLYYVNHIVDIDNGGWVTESEALSILKSYNEMNGDEELSLLERILKLKNDQIRILGEIIKKNSKLDVIVTLKDQNQYSEEHIVKLNDIITQLQDLIKNYTK